MSDDSFASLDTILGLAVYVACETCDGTGRVYPSDSSRALDECPTCRGTRSVIVKLRLTRMRELLKRLL